MKKIFTLFLLLSLTITVQAWGKEKKITPTPAVLKEYPFTMTNEEYKKIVNTKQYCYIDGKHYYWIPKYFMGYNTRLYFSRTYKDKSIEKRMFHILIDPKDNPRKCIQQYDEIKRLLIKKYGPPSFNKAAYKIKTPKQYIKIYNKKLDGKTIAFNKGFFTYMSSWEKDKFTIKLKCYKYYKAFFIDLTYVAPETQSAPPVKVAITTKKIDPLTEL